MLFFLVEIYILIDPNKFHWFQKSNMQKKKKKIVLYICSFSYLFTFKKKKKKKKKKSSIHAHFHTFSHSLPINILLLPFFNFLQFSFFSSPFSLFSLPLFARLVNKNFPVKNVGGGGTVPRFPRLLRHCFRGKQSRK